MGAVDTVNWLRECLREDRARRGVRDFFSARVENRKFLKGTELLASDDLPSDVVGSAYGQKLSDRLASHGRRREVVYGTLFLVGQRMGRAWCAPVLLYPGRVSREGVGELILPHWTLNPVLRDELDLAEEVEVELDRVVGEGVLTVRVVASIAQRLHEAWPDLDVSAAADFPHLARPGVLQQRRKENGLALIPASAFALIERSRGVAGILHELEELAANHKSWSLPLQTLMGLRSESAKQGVRDVSQIPAVLSEAQARIVRSARSNSLTLCHGPPGTGKSFTIAAIAIDHVARGQSVLIASEKDHAVDVAWEKIRSLMGSEELAVRAGRSGYLRKLKSFVEDLLAGMYRGAAPPQRAWEEASAELAKELRALRKREERLREEVDEALSRGELVADPNPSWWRWFRQGQVKRKVRNRPLMMEMSAELERSHRKRIRLAQRLLKMRRAIMLDHAMQHGGARRHFRKFLQGLRRRKPGDQEKTLREVDWSALLATLPVWLVRLSDVHRVLPHERHLFDVAIIDESTQCDLASVLPVLQRAQRVVVAGDQRQLRHVSFLSHRRMESMARARSIPGATRDTYNFRDRSLMDLAIDRAPDAHQVGFLDEHFRSRKPIIAFSNEQFYRGRIALMTDRPWESHADALEVHYCGGRRNGDGVNEAEAEALLCHLRAFLTNPSEGPPRLPISIGILSPFRNQVEVLRSKLIDGLDDGLYRALTGRHRLLLGTAHSFQGEERDTVLISLTIDPDTPANVLRFMERPDVFNVSITRARNHQCVFSSIRASDLPRGSLLGRYLSFASGSHPPALPSPHVPDSFADEVQSALMRHDCEVSRAVAVAGVPVDLLARRQGRAVGLDLIGHPGELRGAIEDERIRVLSRAGFTLLPLGLAEWQTRKVDVLREVLRYL